MLLRKCDFGGQFTLRISTTGVGLRITSHPVKWEELIRHKINSFRIQLILSNIN
jgi:hypothetical protein